MLPFETEDRRIRRPAHAGGVLRDGLHDRLEVGRRACNDPQNLSGGGLLLERLCHLRVCLRERTVLLLEFRKEAHVLDGDDRLVGKRLKERDLLRRERAHLYTPNHDDSDRTPFAQQGGR
jgi:hypothetical protein